jgi:hypothetical protein
MTLEAYLQQMLDGNRGDENIEALVKIIRVFAQAIKHAVEYGDVEAVDFIQPVIHDIGLIADV